MGEQEAGACGSNGVRDSPGGNLKMQLAIAEQAAGEPASVRMQSGLLSQTSLQCFLPLDIQLQKAFIR